jgi:hypothetical protein
MGKFLDEDLSGTRVGKLLVLHKTEYKIISGRKRLHYMCQCDCGSKKEVKSTALKGTNMVFSCGCILRDMGMQRRLPNRKVEGKITREYRTWIGIKERCYQKNAKHYHRYGGRGIKVCDRWLNDFDTFLLDMGKRPAGKYSLDRINNDGDYEPQNCRWATKWEQARNTSTNFYMEHNGMNMTKAEWSRYFGVYPFALDGHLNGGKSIAQIYDFYKNKGNIK